MKVKDPSLDKNLLKKIVSRSIKVPFISTSFNIGYGSYYNLNGQLGLSGAFTNLNEYDLPPNLWLLSEYSQ